MPINTPRAIKGTGPMMVRGVSRSGLWAILSPPLWTTKIWKLSGITKDSGGSVLGNCVVTLDQTSTDLPLAKTTSDANGNFSFMISPAVVCYLNAYKVGSPDVAGTTVNTLTSS
jgi:hypothetical protein